MILELQIFLQLELLLHSHKQHHGFGAGERIVITGSTSGTDATVYNNNHTIAAVTNSSTYTVTLASDPTDDTETGLTVRKIVTATIASSNATFANTGIPGNNAVIAVAELAVGAIESVLVYNFGAGYSSAPTISAAAVGDGSATLTGNVGVYAEYSGYFDGDYGLLSGTNKMQDNLYYQDFSYVIKTNTDVETYRDKILELVHPAGMALFGEILVTSNVSVQLFDNATSNTNSTQANTAQVANTENVSLYNYHEVELYTSNTATTNNQVLVEASYEFKSFSSGIRINSWVRSRMDSTGSSTDFDLQLEHGNDLFSLEVSGFFLAFENTGELLLEIDIDGDVGDRLIEETSDFLLTEDEFPIIYDFYEAQLGSILTEDGDGIEINLTGTDSVTIEEYNGDFVVMEDGVYFVQEDEAGEFSQGFKIQQEGVFLAVMTEGRLIQENDIFVLLERQTANPAQLGLESTTPEAFSGLQEIVYVELEKSVGGDSTVRADNISHFVFEDDDTDTVQVRNEDEASNFKLEDFESALELETNTDGIQEGRDASIPSFLTFKDDAADGRAYLLEEPTTIYSYIESEDPTDQFVIVTDNASDTFGDVTDTIILEIEEFVTDTTIKGESYESGTGFLLPMLLFPTAESGSALLDLSFTSRIVIEIDDIQNVRLEDQDGSLLYEDYGVIFYERQETTSVGYQYDLILLEESDGTNPVYIATESSMTEEIDMAQEIEIIFDGNYQLILENVFGSHENGFLVYEDGADKINVVQPSVAASVRVTQALTATGDTLNEGSFLTTGIGNRKYGSVAISELSSEFELITESGISFLSEQSTSRKDNLITEAYERGVVVTGTATQFEFDFNNLIVLESHTALLYVILLEDEPGNILTETNDDFLLESSKIEFQIGVIELEQETPEENSIILETDDPDVFALLQQEDGSKIFTEEDIHLLIPTPERLCGVGLHDLILEEEGFTTRAVDQIKLEDFTRTVNETDRFFDILFHFLDLNHILQLLYLKLQ